MNSLPRLFLVVFQALLPWTQVLRLGGTIRKPNKKSKWLIFFIGASLTSCGLSKDDNLRLENPQQDSSPTTSMELSDSTQTGIIQFLNALKYRNWSARQTSFITSVSAHSGRTKTYFNDTAAESARANKFPLPINSIIVKEIYKSDEITLEGQALMFKIASGSDSASWLWFEGFKPNYTGNFYGRGLTTCINCHSTGKDFIRTNVP